MKIVMIHGRSQQDKDPQAIKDLWLDTVVSGYSATGFAWPNDVECVLPFYGDKLDQLVQQVEGPLLTHILLRGASEDVPADATLRVEILGEMLEAQGISHLDIASRVEGDPIERQRAIARGPQNTRFVLAMLRVLDGTPVGSTMIDQLTRDVWVYLTFKGIRTTINQIVEAAIPEDESCIVIAHSLGSIVAYDVLSKRSKTAPSIPLFMTVGSPLGIRSISERLNRPLAHPPGVGRWVNARDPRDVVALHPLNRKYFDILPPVEDFSSVDNFTNNRHSIEGYLNDPFVIQCLRETLTLQGK